jgi:hypothetical protein
MKRLLIFLATVATLSLSTNAEAGPRYGSKLQGGGDFGLGLMFGSPSGISGKYWLGQSTMALDFGVGIFRGGYGNGDGVGIHGDVLWHPALITANPTLDLPFYVGVGFRFWDHDRYRCDNNNRNCDDDHAHVGIRVPLGIALVFRKVPIDVFFELAPTFDFLLDDREDDIGLYISGAIGVRYYF